MSAAAPNKLVHETPVWKGTARLAHVILDMDPLLRELPNILEEAMKVRKTRLQNESVKAVLAALRSRKIDFESKKPDQNDIVGLIGEILTGTYSEREGNEIIYAKWRIGGTSKSKGLDLISSKRQSKNRTFALLEAKHLHEELKGLGPSSSVSHFRDRFIEGLDELRDEEVQTKLASILMKVNSAIRVGQAVGFPFDLTETKKIFEELLTKQEYSLGVVECSDSKYLGLTTSVETSDAMPNSPNLNGRTVKFAVLQCDDLEAFTDRMFDKHAKRP